MNSDNITLVDLAKAVANDEFVYFYQPQVSMVTGTLSGAEALIRWKKSDTELISPIHFIPLAESSGFIKEITISMISKLIRDMVIINDLNPALTVSFNASAKDFSSPLLVDTIEQAARDHQVNIASLRIELTESVILESDEHTAGNLKRLEELGVGLEMDDFGTGFSSLDMLGQLPFSAVKLDQGIISRMRTSGKNRTIALSSIRMAHSLGMDIVAEGIESRDSYVFLQNAGCTTGQGYWISRPLPLDKYLAFSSKERHWPALRLGLFHMAQLDHIQWRKALMESVFFRSFSEGERSSVDPIIAANDHDHTTCRLGKWYYGQKLEYAGNSLFDALEEPHRRLHEIGRELIATANEGGNSQQITALMRDLSELSAVVIQALQELENNEISNMREEHPELVQILLAKGVS